MKWRLKPLQVVTEVINGTEVVNSKTAKGK